MNETPLSVLLPVLITLPHASGEIPPEIFTQMLENGDSESVLRRRLFSEGDPFTERLYDLPVHTKLLAPYSRFVVDLNRERSEGGPNGVVKSADFQLRPLYAKGYRLSSEERERRLRTYYDPYHLAIQSALEKNPIRFLLDGHSLTSHGPKMGPDEGRPRPALCMGNFGDADGESMGETPVSLEASLARSVRDYAMEKLGEVFPDWDRDNLALLNQPFDGGHILQHYTHPSYPHRVPGLLFEINRDLYLDEEKLEPLPQAIETWQRLILDLTSFILKILD